MSRIVVSSKPRSRNSVSAVSTISRRVSSLAARWGTARAAPCLNMFKEYGRPRPTVNNFLNVFRLRGFSRLANEMLAVPREGAPGLTTARLGRRLAQGVGLAEGLGPAVPEDVGPLHRVGHRGERRATAPLTRDRRARVHQRTVAKVARALPDRDFATDRNGRDDHGNGDRSRIHDGLPARARRP